MGYRFELGPDAGPERPSVVIDLGACIEGAAR